MNERTRRGLQVIWVFFIVFSLIILSGTLGVLIENGGNEYFVLVNDSYVRYVSIDWSKFVELGFVFSIAIGSTLLGVYVITACISSYIEGVSMGNDVISRGLGFFLTFPLRLKFRKKQNKKVFIDTDLENGKKELEDFLKRDEYGEL